MIRPMERLSTPDRHEALIQGIYAAFNAREVDHLLDRMTEDVDWPNAWEGGRLSGREAVREYWQRQWAEIDPEVVPLGVAVLDDGRVAVSVQQTVRSPGGELLSEGRVTHVYAFHGDLVARMDVEDV
jgi:ketosteroid isomerase-like protein